MLGVRYGVCAVTRRRFPVGVSPTRQPLQPEAIGAVMEVTKWLSEDYAWLLHRGTGGGMSTRKAYATREDDTRDRLGGGISLACARAFASAGPTSCSTV